MHDLVVAGVRGVLRSMETFETRKGCRFCTYATFWVRAMLQRLLIEGFTVRCVHDGSAAWRGQLIWRWRWLVVGGGGQWQWQRRLRALGLTRRCEGTLCADRAPPAST